VPVHEGVVQNWMCGYYYRTLMFIVMYRKASSGLSDICFVAVWAG